MSDSEPSSSPEPAARREEPVITTRGLSERSRRLLQGTQRTDAEAHAPRNARPHRVMQSLWWPLLYFVLVLSFADVALVPLCWGALSNWHTGPILLVVGGLVAAQVYVIALGLVFGRDSLASRLGLASLLLLLIFLWVTAGYFGTIYTVDPETWARLGGTSWLSIAGMAWCVLVAVLVGLIGPLLGVHIGARWRLTNADELREYLRTGVEPPPAHRYGLRDVLMLMVLVSLILAIPRTTYDPRTSLYHEPFFWLGMALAAGVALGVSALLLIVLWLLLHGPQAVAPRWVWPTIAYSMWGQVIAVGMALGFGLQHPLGVAIGVLAASSACFSGVLLGLLILRGHGWRMESHAAPLVLK